MKNHTLNFILIRYGNILPYDYNRVKLGITNLHEDYINASWIKTAGKFDFIAAQAPLPLTLLDFWQMIAENKVAVIFALTKIEETDMNGKFVNILYHY